MSAATTGSPATSTVVRGIWLLLGAICVAFAVLAVEQALSLAAGRASWSSQLQAALVSHDFGFGPRSVHAMMQELYTRGLPFMATHLVLGAFALALGVTQFVPAIRRRMPRLHRRLGAATMLATAASMFGSIGFLLFVPMRSSYSGAAFHIGLWALALLTLATLSQAWLAVRARDYRSHMVWMAVTYAALATAPMLRVDWAILGRARQLDMETVNLGSGLLVFSQTLLLMALWIGFVGDRDLSGARSPTAWPRAVPLVLSMLTAAVAVHEGLLAPNGFDVLAAWRGASARLPVQAWVWAIGTLLVCWRGPAMWSRFIDGARPQALDLAAAGTVAAGAALIGLSVPVTDLASAGLPVFWCGYAALGLVLTVLAWRAAVGRTGRNAWGLQWLFVTWLPSQWPGIWLLGAIVGTTPGEATAAAHAVGIGGITVAGIATGFGASLRWRPPAGASVMQASPR